jgi:hypothetical protein
MAYVEQYGYPRHADDSGPFLPTTSGGIICAKCHIIIREPDFTVLRAARAAHRDSGEPAINVDRPPPERIVPSDLSDQERHVLRLVARNRANREMPDSNKVSMVSLIAIGLVHEERRIDRPPLRTLTPDGKRIADVDAEARRQPEQLMAFDLGPAVRR